MPSAAIAQAHIEHLPATSPDNQHRLIVLAAGYTAKTALEFHHYLSWFQGAGRVLVVNHSEGGFSLEAEAEQVVDYVLAPGTTEVYFVGLSLGARLGTAVADRLEDTPHRSRIQGILAICGMNEPANFNGLPPRLWPLMRWPFTAPWFNRQQYVAGKRKHPGPPWQVDLLPHHTQAIAYGINFPGRARRAQVRGIARLRPLERGRYADIPMCYLTTPNDQVLHATPAADGFAAGFGSAARIRSMPKGQVRHCSLNEHPFAWAETMAEVFRNWGVPLLWRDFQLLA